MEDKMLYFMNKLIDEDIDGFDDEKFELEQKIRLRSKFCMDFCLLLERNEQ